MPSRRDSLLLLTALVMAALYRHMSAQPTCNASIANLAPCLDFLSGNSTASPSPECCSQLENAMETEADCLCSILRGSTPIEITVNETRALALPRACDIRTPSLSQCLSGVDEAALPPEGSLDPVSGAPPAVALPPPASPRAPPSDAEGPRGREPTGAASPRHKGSLLMLLFIASCASTFFGF